MGGMNTVRLETAAKLRDNDDAIERAYSGKCTKDDALSLYWLPDMELFALADRLRREAVGDVVTYVVNRNINFTDDCIGTCRFCAFRGREHFSLSTKEILDKVKEASSAGATEVCIQGGLKRSMSLSDYCGILECIKAELPGMHIHAFSPMEVMHASRNSDVSVKKSLDSLKSSGLGSMPGTAAEIFSHRVRSKICPDKLTAAEWADVVKTAHRNGIPTTATIMYGHIETVGERIDHILTIRDIQEETHMFTEFVPLPFMPHNNALGKELMAGGAFGTTGIEDLKLHALARILLHTHIPNIQASWVKLGRKAAQIALRCGANDLGGTLMEERISRSAGASSGEYMSPREFSWLIRGAGRKPAERTTLYEIVGYD